jgi:hypothetical protein
MLSYPSPQKQRTTTISRQVGIAQRNIERVSINNGAAFFTAVTLRKPVLACDRANVIVFRAGHVDRMTKSNLPSSSRLGTNRYFPEAVMGSFNEAITIEERFLSQRARTKTGCVLSAAYADNDAVVRRTTRITLFRRSRKRALFIRRAGGRYERTKSRLRY